MQPKAFAFSVQEIQELWLVVSFPHKTLQIHKMLTSYQNVCLSVRFYNSCRRLPETKSHSSLFLHWSGSKFLVVMAACTPSIHVFLGRPPFLLSCGIHSITSFGILSSGILLTWAYHCSLSCQNLRSLICQLCYAVRVLWVEVGITVQRPCDRLIPHLGSSNTLELKHF